MILIDLHTKFHIPNPIVSYITIKLATRLHGHYIVSVLNFTKLINPFSRTFLYFISGLRIKFQYYRCHVLRSHFSPFCMSFFSVFQWLELPEFYDISVSLFTSCSEATYPHGQRSDIVHWSRSHLQIGSSILIAEYPQVVSVCSKNTKSRYDIIVFTRR